MEAISEDFGLVDGWQGLKGAWDLVLNLKIRIFILVNGDRFESIRILPSKNGNLDEIKC